MTINVQVSTMSPELIEAIQNYIQHQTGNPVVISNIDYSLFNDRIHFIVDGKGHYRLNLVKGTISRPTGGGYSRVIRVNSIESGESDLAIIKSLITKS